jgi:hypothetical protein
LQPTVCPSPLGNLDQGCAGIVCCENEFFSLLLTLFQLSAWAMGGGSTVTPPDVGFSMGAKDNAIKYLILEVHYNNPDGVGGYLFVTQ